MARTKCAESEANDERGVIVVDNEYVELLQTPGTFGVLDGGKNNHLIHPSGSSSLTFNDFTDAILAILKKNPRDFFIVAKNAELLEDSECFRRTPLLEPFPEFPMYFLTWYHRQSRSEGMFVFNVDNEGDLMMYDANNLFGLMYPEKLVAPDWDDLWKKFNRS